MKTPVYKIENVSDEEAIRVLNACGTLLRQGKLVCFPTETVYGLGANAFDPEAVRAVYAAKGRPADNPLIVHIADIETAYEITDMTREERARFELLAHAFWPGPLTLIVTKNEKIPAEVSCGLSTVGLRFPEHPVAQAFIRAAGIPVAAPSANTSGRPSPTLARHVSEDMDGKVAAILDGGACRVGLESTVLDLTGEVPFVLRPGGVTLEMLQRVLPETRQLGWRGSGSDDSGEPPRSPGLKYRHYAPRAKSVILTGKPEAVVGCISRALTYAEKRGVKARALVSDESAAFFPADAPLVRMGGRYDGERQAAGLFRLLRELDEDGIEEAYMEAVPETGVGFAVMNRLYRAAGCQLATVRTVMFVCTGNTCRSYMAEYLYRDILEKRVAAGDLSACAVSVCSAGLFASEGAAGSRMAQEVLAEEFGIDGSEHRSAPLTHDGLQSADLILTMTKEHKTAILRAFPEFDRKVYTLGEYGHGEDVEDPFAGSFRTYSACAHQILDLIRGTDL